ncbi:hypothetical protein T492DRAFT_838328 [Pavlovales sp. CCMP2436]|nr:hypothetical protein T492DRAFT_838328 [Pavlovales sp. CCMP2436]
MPIASWAWASVAWPLRIALPTKRATNTILSSVCASPWLRFTGVGSNWSGFVTGWKAYPVTAHAGFFVYSSTKRFLVGSSLCFDERFACDEHTGQRRIFPARGAPAYHSRDSTPSSASRSRACSTS